MKYLFEKNQFLSFGTNIYKTIKDRKTIQTGNEMV